MRRTRRPATKQQNPIKHNSVKTRLDQSFLRRKQCCWNCFKIGHLRFQCPEPKRVMCSFCRKPATLSIECTCRSNPSQDIQLNPHEIASLQIAEFPEFVAVPNAQADEYVQLENLAVVIENDMSQYNYENDILEIPMEYEPLDEI